MTKTSATALIQIIDCLQGWYHLLRSRPRRVVMSSLVAMATRFTPGS
jgi:hypothetical protein